MSLTESASGFVHECQRSTNPRYQNTCQQCGRVMPNTEGPTRRRNVELEREFTREAAKGIVDPTALIEFSEARIMRLCGKYVDDPAYVRMGRDRLHDMREELSDCRNHGVFWQEENIGVDEDQERRVAQAQRHVAIAYDLLLDED